MSVPYAQPFRVTVDEFYRMAEVGIIRPGARLELIDGEIIEMSPIGKRHSSCVLRLTMLLTERLGRDALVNVQNPLVVGDSTQPQPDLAVLRPRPDFYADAHPTPADTLLVIEVADSSVLFDRNVKAALYARAGIAEFWLVDLTRDEVVVHSAPSAGEYTDLDTFERAGSWTSRALSGRSFDGRDILG